MSRFAADIAAYAKETGATLDQTARAVKVELFTGVIMDTRVDTGRLRGNWQTTTGSPAPSEVERLDPIPRGVPGGSAYDDAVGGVRGDTVDYLTNNLPYAEVWEDKDGMIAKNLARINQILRRARG
jgi:hypothetical protein